MNDSRLRKINDFEKIKIPFDFNENMFQTGLDSSIKDFKDSFMNIYKVEMGFIL
jgi:hypothetical protein